MKSIFPIIILTALLAACISTPESNKASEETAWDLLYQLEDMSGLTIAVGAFDTTDVPETLETTFRNDLSTTLAIAFRETGQDHKVVTRDKVDCIRTKPLRKIVALDL